jgi:hypothetical protein
MAVQQQLLEAATVMALSRTPSSACRTSHQVGLEDLKKV